MAPPDIGPITPGAPGPSFGSQFMDGITNAAAGFGGGVIDGFAGLPAAVAGQGISSLFSARAANQQFQRMKDATIRGPSWQVLGLKKAGLNPILAAQGGFRAGSGSVPMPHMAQQQVHGQGRSLLDAQKALSQAQAIKTYHEGAAASGVSKSRAYEAYMAEKEWQWYQRNPEAFERRMLMKTLPGNVTSALELWGEGAGGGTSTALKIGAALAGALPFGRIVGGVAKGLRAGRAARYRPGPRGPRGGGVKHQTLGKKIKARRAANREIPTVFGPYKKPRPAPAGAGDRRQWERARQKTRRKR